MDVRLSLHLAATAAIGQGMAWAWLTNNPSTIAWLRRIRAWQRRQP